MDDEVWNHFTFTENRDRLLKGEIARRFFARVPSQAKQADLLSKEHVSGGGRSPTVDFHGEKRSRDTHESKTDKDALLSKKSKGTATRLSYMGHILMENRHGLVVNATVSQATGRAGREAAAELVDALGGPSNHTGRGQELRYRRLYCEDAREEGHAAYHPK